jgi:hypothetical protein
MHVDKIEDHVISAILHVGHAYDNEDDPWPLVIESFDGTTQSVNLEPGEMLFYESAKCMHGRPRPFHGKYYSSIFIHYLPTDWTHNSRDSQYMVPEHWLDGLEEANEKGGKNDDPKIPRLEIIGTGFHEPDCPDGWCNMIPRRPLQYTAAPDNKALPGDGDLGKLRGKRPLVTSVDSQHLLGGVPDVDNGGPWEAVMGTTARWQRLAVPASLLSLAWFLARGRKRSGLKKF